MIIDYFVARCQTHSSRPLFGLCDDPAPATNRAYISEDNGGSWIAIVENENRFNVTFTAIDHCIDIRRPDRTMAHRCDGLLTYNTTAILVELKQQGGLGNQWVIQAESQLRESIVYFEREDESNKFTTKRAYIANSEHPKFKETQMQRMERFFNDTEYVLQIVNRIKL
jgi:hypothetical protein